jgi:hypothetical protein
LSYYKRKEVKRNKGDNMAKVTREHAAMSEAKKVGETEC